MTREEEIGGKHPDHPYMCTIDSGINGFPCVSTRKFSLYFRKIGNDIHEKVGNRKLYVHSNLL